MNVPTIANPNLYTTYLKDVKQSGFTGIEDITAEDGALTVAYTTGRLIINGRTSDQVQVLIHNMAGQTIASQTTPLTGGHAEISLSSIPHGVYVAVVSDSDGHQATCKFIVL